MKLLTKTGLLYSAVQSQTVDGHYGTFPEIDWTSVLAEGLQTTAIPGTLGLNPMVRSLETCYDGGKLMSGYGWFTGTATTGWMVKLFGTFACGGTDVVSVASGYNVLALGLASTAATCVTTTHWIWSALNDGQTNTIDRSTMVVDAAEEWKNGTLKLTSAAGVDPWMIAVGGLSANATFGLGIWNMMIWGANYLGIASTVANYGTGFVAETATGANGADLFQMGLTSTNASTTKQTGALNTAMQNSCLTSVAQYTKVQTGTYGGEGAVVTGGFSTSANGCMDYVTDEYNLTGIYVLFAFEKVLTIAPTGGAAPGTAVTAQIPVISIGGHAAGTGQYLAPAAPLDNPATNSVYSMNFGVLTQVEDINGTNNAAATVLSCIVLFTAPEQYGKSEMVGHHVASGVIIRDADATTFDLTQANYGQIKNVWAFSKANSGQSVGLWVTTDTHVAFTGMRLGKGVFSMAILSTTRTFATAADTDVYAVPSPTWLAATATGVSYVGATPYTREIKSPAGGVNQFKGLTQDASNDKYVEVACRKIHPYFGATAWQDIDNTTAGTTGTSGFILSCMTGISQCINDITATVSTRSATNSLLTTTEHATCLNDPRYLTWRQMTIVIEWDGTVVWWRTDSFWNPAEYVTSSAWGPGTVMSSHIASGTDNSTITTADRSKSYVFALADGSGLQLSHITGGSAVVTAPTGNTAAGSGANTLTTSPTSFKNSSPNRVDQNYCSSTNLNLTGLADTSALAATVTAYSDGYQATITMALDWIQAGAQGGWRGVCMVYYTSQYIQDDTNGAVCMTAVQSTGTGLGSDLGGVYLIHVPATTWQPPAMTGSVTPASLALTDAKYGIVNTPSATQYTYTGGYYASSAWYQPKYASSYADIARFGKDRYTGAYCMQGSGATSYFSAPAAGVQLQSAVTLAAGAIALGSAILAM